MFINEKQDIELTDALEYFIEKVAKEQVEIELTITPENQNLIVRPWKPVSFNCPYKE